MIWLYFLLSVGGAFFAINLFWRYASRRFQLPCPSSLSFLVEGGKFDWFSGTQETLELMAIKPGERLLEIGPGPGRLLIPAAGMVGSSGAAVGLELQPKMIEKLKRNAEKAGVKNLQVFQGDASRSQSLQDFDLVYLCTVLGEIPDRAAALQNAWTFLKPGGRLCITEMLGDPHYQSKKTCQQLAEAAGFHRLRTEGSWRRFTMTLERPA